MALSDIALCARALVMIGAAPIASFEEDSAEAEVAGMLYPAIRDAMLAGYPWRFAARGAWLARLSGGENGAEGADGASGAGSADGTGDRSDTGDTGGAHLFALPGDFIRLLSLGGDAGPLPEFEVRDRVVMCRAERAFLTYVGRLPEGGFPAWFDLALIARLAAEFCVPLTESSTRAEHLHKRAEDQFRHARLADAQQSTPHAISDFSLLAARN